MKFHKKWFLVTSLFMITNLLSGCNMEDTEDTDVKEMISGISIGMTKEEVFATVEAMGADYAYCEDYMYDYEYKSTVEYGYYLDNITVFDIDIDMTAQLFLEFQDDETLVCYGYHIGGTGEYDNLSYPYSEQELLEAYDSIYSQLYAWYGESDSSSEYAEYGVIKENSWDSETDTIWFIVGTNLWADTEPDRYENGVNEIVLSCSALERET